MIQLICSFYWDDDTHFLLRLEKQDNDYEVRYGVRWFTFSRSDVL